MDKAPTIDEMFESTGLLKSKACLYVLLVANGNGKDGSDAYSIRGSYDTPSQALMEYVLRHRGLNYYILKQINLQFVDTD